MVAGKRPLKHVGVHRPEGGRGLVAEAIVERLHDPALEVDSRVGGKHGVPIGSRDLAEPVAEDIRLDPAGH